jgi:glycine/sarcosine N-methyltransferase
MSEVPLWDALSADYDRFVNWEGRLAEEMPFFESLLAEHEVRRVLDVACGTGRHAIALAQRGYEVLGTDISESMVTRARQNAGAAGAHVVFLQASFGELEAWVGEPYHALLCLGNSLPSLLSEDALKDALADMAGVLVPGGLLVVQNLNYDRVWPQQQRFMPLQTHRQGDEEWLFFRFVDFHNETLTFNMVVLHKDDGAWSYRSEATELRPIFKQDLERLLKQTGFADLDFYGDYRFNPYQQDTSSDLIVVARKK